MIGSTKSLLDLFNNDALCIYCGKEKSRIVQLVISPIDTATDKAHEYYVSAKCIECLAKEEKRERKI